jgi:MFS superfamily sulfate permease-like transporter
LSAGTYAVPSLMTATVITRFKDDLYPSESLSSNITSNTTTSDYLFNNPDDAKVYIAMSLSFFSGIIQILFGVFHLGFITKYLSDAIVNGFTMGAATFVIVSQIPNLLGIKIPDSTTPFTVIEVILI